MGSPCLDRHPFCPGPVPAVFRLTVRERGAKGWKREGRRDKGGTRERESVCVCVCVCVRERERERERDNERAIST
jgi:hypothetical protein